MIWRALPASACLGFCLRLDRKKTGRDFRLLPPPAAFSTFFVCSRAACALEQAPWSASSERGLNNLSFSAYQEAFEARASGLQVRRALPGSRGLFLPGHSSRWAASKTRLVFDSAGRCVFCVPHSCRKCRRTTPTPGTDWCFVQWCCEREIVLPTPRPIAFR